MTLSRLPTRCKHCKEKFTPGERGLRIHAHCIDDFLTALKAKKERDQERERKAKQRVERALDRKRLEKLKPNGKKKAEAQSALNRWVVHGRDAGKPCISCGRMHEGAWHGGHYKSRGSAPHLALDPRNVHRQCAPCNLYLHGNLINFRLGLVERYGLAYVEELEADQEPRHYSGDDFEAIKALYVRKLKEIKEKA